MTATTESQSSRNGTGRTAAQWMAATGAFLLVAAAAVFVAVQWDRIPDAVKFAALVLVTAAAVVGGRMAKDRIPATATVLVHLGAFLVPIDAAAAALRVDLEWPEMLLVVSAIAAVVWVVLGRLERSVVLRRCADAAAVAVALGCAAVFGVAAPFLLLAAAFVCAWWDETRRDAQYLLAGAALLPIVSVALLPFTGATWLAPTVDVPYRLGLVGPPQWWVSGLAAVACVAVAAVIMRRGANAIVMVVGVVGALAHVSLAWIDADLGLRPIPAALAAIFVLAELAALALRDDDVYRRPASIVATTFECIAVAVVLPAVVFATVVFVVLLAVRADFAAQPEFALAFAFTAIAAVIAALRNRAVEDAVWVCAPPTALAAVMLMQPVSPWWWAGAAAVFAATAFVSRRIAMTAWILPALAAGIAAGGSVRVLGAAGVVLAGAVIFRHRPRLTVGALAAHGALLASVGVAVSPDPLWFGVSLLVVVITALGVVYDVWDVRLGWIARASMLALAPLVVAALAADGARFASAPLALAALCILFDCARRRIPAYASASAAPFVAAIAMFASSFSVITPALLGVVLAVVAALAVIVLPVVPKAWQVTPILVASLAGSAALGLASNDAHAFALLLVIAGVALVSTSVQLRNDFLAVGGVAAWVIASWIDFGARQVQMTEPYVVPAALLCIGVGFALRRRDPNISTWIAYGPGLAAICASGLIERFHGGDADHALFVGAVAVVAVMIGGWRRLGAPLFIGTAALVVVVIREALALGVSVPTWVWLAIGGSMLLGGGIALERTDTSPTEAGKRVVDVVGHRFQ